MPLTGQEWQTVREALGFVEAVLDADLGTQEIAQLHAPGDLVSMADLSGRLRDLLGIPKRESAQMRAGLQAVSRMAEEGQEPGQGEDEPGGPVG